MKVCDKDCPFREKILDYWLLFDIAKEIGFEIYVCVCKSAYKLKYKYKKGKQTSISLEK